MIYRVGTGNNARGTTRAGACPARTVTRTTRAVAAPPVADAAVPIADQGAAVSIAVVTVPRITIPHRFHLARTGKREGGTEGPEQHEAQGVDSILGRHKEILAPGSPRRLEKRGGAPFTK
jgi:hypothetical protein